MNLMNELRICLLLCSFMMATLPAFANILDVGPDLPVTTVQEALCLATDGDTIDIYRGLYQEDVLVVDKSLTIRGRGFPVLDGQSRHEILIVVADGVTIEGIQFQHVGHSYLEDRAAIRVRRSRDFVIRNNYLLDAFFGIYLEKAREGRVEGNTIVGQARKEMSAGNGIHAWYCNDLLISGNTVNGHRDGIYFEFVDDSRIRDNLSEGNLRYGLHFMFSNRDQYFCNTFKNNGAGVAVMFSRYIEMTQNEFVRNWGRAAYGLLLKEIYDATIEDNKFEENTVGIYVEGSTRVRYANNELRRNGWAIKMAGGCQHNDFTANNFLHNTLDLVVNGQSRSNSYDGNYWSEYTGYDLDRDGVGDVPHRPVRLYSYVLEQTPESIILLRSLFIYLLDLSEKINPSFTPVYVLDHRPNMKRS